MSTQTLGPMPGMIPTIRVTTAVATYPSGYHALVTELAARLGEVKGGLTGELPQALPVLRAATTEARRWLADQPGLGAALARLAGVLAAADAGEPVSPAVLADELLAVLAAIDATPPLRSLAAAHAVKGLVGAIAAVSGRLLGAARREAEAGAPARLSPARWGDLCMNLSIFGGGLACGLLALIGAPEIAILAAAVAAGTVGVWQAHRPV